MNQYHSPDNIDAHYRLDRPEIWEQTDGRIDAFVGGMGTGGTITGVGRWFKEQDPNVKIIGVDPLGSVYHLFKTKKLPPRTSTRSKASAKT